MKRSERSDAEIQLSKQVVQTFLSREVARHGGRYRAAHADEAAWEAARRPQSCRLADNPRLRWLVACKLGQQWSPEQIAGWLKLRFPLNQALQVSHKTIYRSLFIQARVLLKKELLAHLRRRRRMRHSKLATAMPRGGIIDAVSSRERPAEVEDRAVPGHWEGDLIKGARNQSAIGTLVERTSRLVLLVRLPHPNPATAAHVLQAFTDKLNGIAAPMRQSLTYDRGREMAEHAQLTRNTGMKVYFCDPYSPWQRGSNENTNGLLRQYFPKGTDLSGYSQEYLDGVADELNGRPRMTLGWSKPIEVYAEHLARLAQQPDSVH